MNAIQLVHINGSPVFVIDGLDSRFGRVHGAIRDKENNRWLIPAYPPFGQVAFSDLMKVAPGMELTPDAQKHAEYLADVDRRIKAKELPPGFTFVTKPFDHQIEGLALAFYNPRFGLLFDPGLGKSKIFVDLIRLLHQTGDRGRTLIITPKVTVRNWLEEIARHGGGQVTRMGEVSGGSLSAKALYGNQERKRKIIAGYKKYDVLICSYGTARTLGHPQLTHKSAKAIMSAVGPGMRTVNSAQELGRVVKHLSHQERQDAYIVAWALGMTVAEIERQVASEISKVPRWLEDIEFSNIICDESQYIKEGSSKQTQAILALSKKASRRYLSSGTAVLGDPRDIYPQLKFLSPALIPEDWLDFSNTFLIRSKYNPRIILGFKNMDLLNRRIQRMSISRKKEDCLDLPPRTIIDVPFEMSKQQTRMYNQLITEQEADLTQFFTDPDSSTLSVQNAITRLGKLSQIASGFVYTVDRDVSICNGCPHLKTCVERNIQPYTQNCQVVRTEPEKTAQFFKENPRLTLLEEKMGSILVDPRAKVIVWAWYQPELQQIRELCTRRGWDFVTVDGKTQGNVQAKITKFQTDPKVKVWVGQEATGIGITLTAATYMIYYSYDFALGPYLQSIDRNYRVGQTEKVVVYRLVAKGTIDEYKIRALDQKQNISSMLTRKLACATCPKRVECLSKGIELFGAGCMYQRETRRIVAKAQVIEDALDSGEE